MRWSSSRGEDTDPSDSAFNFAIEHDILDVLTPLLHFIDNARLSGMINEEYLFNRQKERATCALSLYN